MTHRHYLVAAACLLLLACNKQAQQAPSPVSSIASNAYQYFEDSVLSSSAPAAGFRGALPKTVAWSRSWQVKLGAQNALEVPVRYNTDVLVTTGITGSKTRLNLNDFTSLVFYRTAQGGLGYFLLTTIPDSAYLHDPLKPFTGIKALEDWKGNLVARYLYQKGKPVLRNKEMRPRSPNQRTTISNLISITVEYYLDGYNYSGDGSDGEYWSEYLGSSTTYIPDGGSGTYSGTDVGGLPTSGGDGGGTGLGAPASNNGAATNVYEAPPAQAITDVNKYFFCFTNSPTAQYTVSVCVQQPVSGSRSPWTLSSEPATSIGDNPINVGHTILVFTETDNGVTTTRNVGFYPQATPVGDVPGVLNNDESHSFNVSATFSTIGALFSAMENFVSQPGLAYNLSNFNCTAFAITALECGHIYLPSTRGSWLGGIGNDPGDFDEDILGSNAPGIQKNVLPGEHFNTGYCVP